MKTNLVIVLSLITSYNLTIHSYESMQQVNELISNIIDTNRIDAKLNAWGSSYGKFLSSTQGH